MTDLAQHADPHLLDDPRTALLALRTAEFSDDAQVLDGLARSEATGEVLRKIAHNPASVEHTLEHLIDLDRIARRLTDRNAIFHASSAPNAAPETLRYLASHPSAPPATLETVTSRIGVETVPAA